MKKRMPEMSLGREYHGSSAIPTPSRLDLCISRQLPTFKRLFKKGETIMSLIVETYGQFLYCIFISNFYNVYGDRAKRAPSWTSCTFSIVDLLASVWSNQTPPPHLKTILILIILVLKIPILNNPKVASCEGGVWSKQTPPPHLWTILNTNN